MTTCLLNRHEDLPPPPEGTRYVRHQAGGHHSKNGDLLIPNLEHHDGSFLKLYRNPNRGATEVAFYQRVFDMSSSDPSLVALRELVPKFDGIYTAHVGDKEVQFLKVEDITRRFERPCVLDIKLKADVHDPSSDHSHPVYVFARNHGFLIDGIHIYHRATKKYVSWSKEFGRNLDDSGAKKALASYLNADGGLDKWIIKALVQRLERVQMWAHQQRHFSFYRSSLLLVYDAQDSHCATFDEALSRTDVRLVDFAKVYSSDRCDQRYLEAVSNLLDHFKEFLNSSH